MPADGPHMDTPRAASFFASLRSALVLLLLLTALTGLLYPLIVTGLAPLALRMAHRGHRVASPFDSHWHLWKGLPLFSPAAPLAR